MPARIAVKLRVLREQRGLTHKEAAKLANVSPWTLCRLESGERDPYMPTVTKIARAYGEIGRCQAKVEGRDDVTPIAVRVTMIFRPEDGEWKVVHRHADPITTTQPAESVIQE